MTTIGMYGSLKSSLSLFLDQSMHEFYAQASLLFKEILNIDYLFRSNLRDYFKYLEKELHIEVVDDWYRVSLRQIASHGSISFSKHYEGLYLCYFIENIKL
jgi:hypothetical protein